jgi:hypothetical protein
MGRCTSPLLLFQRIGVRIQKLRKHSAHYILHGDAVFQRWPLNPQVLESLHPFHSDIPTNFSHVLPTGRDSCDLMRRTNFRPTFSTGYRYNLEYRRESGFRYCRRTRQRALTCRNPDMGHRFESLYPERPSTLPGLQNLIVQTIFAARQR